MAWWWNNSEFIEKKKEIQNSLVICFSADGCMASDHNFKWIGRVSSVILSNSEHLKDHHQVFIKILKDDDLAGDIRDSDLGTKLIILENSQLQKIEKGLFFYYV